MYTSLHAFCWVDISLVLNIWKRGNARNIQKLLEAKKTKHGLNMIHWFNSCRNCIIVNFSLLNLKVHLLESVSEFISVCQRQVIKDSLLRKACLYAVAGTDVHFISGMPIAICLRCCSLYSTKKCLSKLFVYFLMLLAMLIIY